MLEKLYLGDILEKLPKAARHIYTVIVVLIGWVFFFFTDLSAIKAFFAAAFGANGFADVTQNAIITNYIVVLLVGAVFSVPVFSKILALGNRLCESKIGKVLVNVSCVIFTFSALWIATAALVGSSYNPFLYFRF